MMTMSALAAGWTEAGLAVLTAEVLTAELWLLADLWLLAQAAAPIDAEKLDPVTRARLMMALTAVVLLGFLMVMVALVGARWLRRTLRRSDTTAKRPPIEDKWYAKPLVESPQEPEA